MKIELRHLAYGDLSLRLLSPAVTLFQLLPGMLLACVTLYSMQSEAVVLISLQYFSPSF